MRVRVSVGRVANCARCREPIFRYSSMSRQGPHFNGISRDVGRCPDKGLSTTNFDDDIVKKEVKKGVKEEVKNDAKTEVMGRVAGNRQIRSLCREHQPLVCHVPVFALFKRTKECLMHDAHVTKVAGLKSLAWSNLLSCNSGVPTY